LMFEYTLRGAGRVCMGVSRYTLDVLMGNSW